MLVLIYFLLLFKKKNIYIYLYIFIFIKDIIKLIDFFFMISFKLIIRNTYLIYYNLIKYTLFQIIFIIINSQKVNLNKYVFIIKFIIILSSFLI